MTNQNKRYFIWRDESAYVHCDVLVGETHTYPLAYFGIALRPFGEDSYGSELTSASTSLAMSILMEYSRSENNNYDLILAEKRPSVFREFANTFLGSHHANSQNFYISEVEIRLFIETCDAEVEATT